MRCVCHQWVCGSEIPNSSLFKVPTQATDDGSRTIPSNPISQKQNRHRPDELHSRHCQVSRTSWGTMERRRRIFRHLISVDVCFYSGLPHFLQPTAAEAYLPSSFQGPSQPHARRFAHTTPLSVPAFSVRISSTPKPFASRPPGR